MSKTVLITGGTGLIGKHLSKILTAQGFDVRFLSRKEGLVNGIQCFRWDIAKQYIDKTAFNGVTYLIHLAGAGIADHRWTEAYKKEIYDSRIDSTKLLAKTLGSIQHSIKAVVSTSAIGIYGNDIKGSAAETYPAATNFLALVCADWEGETKPISEMGIRTAIIRVGVVLAKESGFVPEVAKPIRYLMGAALGSGKQRISWIHIDDLCGIFTKALLDENMKGPYNAVSPIATDNSTVTKAIAKLLHKPILLPAVPFFVLKLLFGELATLLVANQQVSATKIEGAGYRFKHTNLENALATVV